jgi:hypothetical protein
MNSGLLLLISLLAGAACVSPDPLASEEAFLERAYGNLDADGDADATEDTTPDIGSGGNPCLEDDLSGTLMLSFLVFPLDVPGEKPFNIRTDLTREDDGQYTFRFQPLATDNITNEVNEIVPRVAVGAEGDENYSPAPRTNVGLSIEVPDVEVNIDGTFTLDVTQIRVVGFANPITYRDILADLVLTGRFYDTNVGCGTVGGNVQEPIRLNLTTNARQTTFGFIRVADDAALTTQTPVPICSAPELASACGDTAEGSGTPEGSGTTDGSGN